MKTKLYSAIEYLMNNPDTSAKDLSNKFNMSIRHAERARQRYNEDKNLLDKKLPKVLLFDIETAPMEVYTWDIHKQFINSNFIIKDRSCLSYSAKWLFESEIMSEVVTPEEATNRIDKSIIQGIWNLLNEADIIIAHNANRFDVKRLNTRFIINGLQPPMVYQVIDTLKVAWKYFDFASNKLDDLNAVFGFSRKIHTDFDLWKRCVTGDKNALNEMVRYNKGDIVALEELYVCFRPWIKSHPNLGLYVESEGTICPNCGSENIKWSDQFYYTPAGKYATFRCECGAIGRSRKTGLDPKYREKLGLSVAR